MNQKRIDESISDSLNQFTNQTCISFFIQWNTKEDILNNVPIFFLHTTNKHNKPLYLISFIPTLL